MNVLLRGLVVEYERERREKKLRRLVGGYLFVLASVLLIVNWVVIRDEEFYNILVIAASLLISTGIPLMAAKRHPYIISAVLTFVSLLVNVEYLCNGTVFFSAIIGIIMISVMVGLLCMEKRLEKFDEAAEYSEENTVKKLRQKAGGIILIFAGVLLTVDLCGDWYREYNQLLLVASLLIPTGIPLMAAKRHPYIILTVLTFASLLINLEYITTGGIFLSIIIDAVLLLILIVFLFLDKKRRAGKEPNSLNSLA